MKVIDAEGLIVGRMATYVAKTLMSGEEIAIVNAEKAVVGGGRGTIIADYQKMMTLNHPRKGPHFPRMPDKMLKRHIRGMVPYQRPSGRAAFKNLKVYIGVPKEFSGKKLETVEQAKKTLRCEYMTIGDISKYFGAKF